MELGDAENFNSQKLKLNNGYMNLKIVLLFAYTPFDFL